MKKNGQISSDNFGVDQFLVMSLKIPLNSIPITASKPPVSEPVHKTLLNCWRELEFPEKIRN